MIDPAMRYAQFASACRDVARCGHMTAPIEVMPGFYSATATRGHWREIAYELAARLPGVVWPGARSVSWCCGANAPHGRLMDTDSVKPVLLAGATMKLLGASEEKPWSVGRIGLSMLQWAVPADRCPCTSECLLSGITGGYHDCLPGVYQRMHMHDVRAFYHAMLLRAKGPRLVVNKHTGALLWGSLTPDERARWRDMLAAVSEDHLLRNSLVGSCMGARGWRPVFLSGPGPADARGFDPRAPAHIRYVRLPGGKYRGVGLLIMRSGWELCQIASCQANSVYSTMDSVTTLDTRAPSIWRQTGFESRVKAAGSADIIRRGCWSIGHVKTLTYRAGMKHADGVPRADMPSRLYYRQWLT